jgi:hypothetical protein
VFLDADEDSVRAWWREACGGFHTTVSAAPVRTTVKRAVAYAFGVSGHKRGVPIVLTCKGSAHLTVTHNFYRGVTETTLWDECKIEMFGPPVRRPRSQWAPPDFAERCGDIFKKEKHESCKQSIPAKQRRVDIRPSGSANPAHQRTASPDGVRVCRVNGDSRSDIAGGGDRPPDPRTIGHSPSRRTPQAGASVRLWDSPYDPLWSQGDCLGGVLATARPGNATKAVRRIVQWCRNAPDSWYRPRPPP